MQQAAQPIPPQEHMPTEETKAAGEERKAAVEETKAAMEGQRTWLEAQLDAEDTTRFGGDEAPEVSDKFPGDAAPSSTPISAADVEYAILFETSAGKCKVKTAETGPDSFNKKRDAEPVPQSPGLTYAKGSEDYVFEPGQGLPGRAMLTGHYAWSSNVQKLTSSEFPRLDLAKKADIKGVFCIYTSGGVVELGSTQELTAQDWQTYFDQCNAGLVALPKSVADSMPKQPLREIPSKLHDFALGSHPKAQTRRQRKCEDRERSPPARPNQYEELGEEDCDPCLNPDLPDTAESLRRVASLQEDVWQDSSIHRCESSASRQIGAGRYAQVYAGEFRGMRVAVKKSCHPSASPEGVTFQREAQLMQALQHPNIVRMLAHGKRSHLLGAVPVPEGREALEMWPFIILELVDGTNLKRAQVTGTLRKLNLGKVLAISVQLSDALCYLHSHPSGTIIHRDVKLTNVILESEHSKPVLIDFGQAWTVADSHTLTDHESEARAGVYEYMTPEVYRCHPYTASVDVYAFGVVLRKLLEQVLGMSLRYQLQVALLSVPWGVAPCARTFEWAHNLPPDPKWPQEWRDLVSACCAYRSKDRPPIAEVNKRLRSIMSAREYGRNGGGESTF